MTLRMDLYKELRHAFGGISFYYEAYDPKDPVGKRVYSTAEQIPWRQMEYFRDVLEFNCYERTRNGPVLLGVAAVYFKDNKVKELQIRSVAPPREKGPSSKRLCVDALLKVQALLADSNATAEHWEEARQMIVRALETCRMVKDGAYASNQ